MKIPKIRGLLLSGRVINQHLTRLRQAEPRPSMGEAAAHLRPGEMQRARKKTRPRLSMMKNMSLSMRRRLRTMPRKMANLLAAKRQPKRRAELQGLVRPVKTIRIYLRIRRLDILNPSCQQKERSRRKKKTKIYRWNL